MSEQTLEWREDVRAYYVPETGRFLDMWSNDVIPVLPCGNVKGHDTVSQRCEHCGHFLLLHECDRCMLCAYKNALLGKGIL